MDHPTNQDPENGTGRAIVIGAGTTGLVAAAAAARHFDHVIVIDRDELPAGPQGRKGVPQSRHLHLLLERGEQIFNEYFPGLSAELQAHGAHRLDMGRDTQYFHSCGWRLRFDSGVTMMSQTKGLLEWTIRQQLLRKDNVTIRDLTPVADFLTHGTRICGVQLGDGSELTAELVIDCSGRNSRTAARLKQLGFGDVETSELEIGLSYSTQIYQRPAETDDWQVMIVHPKHPDTKLGAIQTVEGDRWVATLAGWYDAKVPGDAAGFTEYAHSLASPALAEAIAHAEPIGDIQRWRYPSNLRRHYEKLATMPDGLVVVGDAACSFSPIYGQGMTQGASGARFLDECLSAQTGPDRIAGLSRIFQQRYAKFASGCWLIATAEDFAAMKSAPGRPIGSGLVSRYMHHIHRLTFRDELVALRFLQVMHMVRPLSTLMTVPIMLRVLRQALADRFCRHSSSGEAPVRPTRAASPR